MGVALPNGQVIEQLQGLVHYQSTTGPVLQVGYTAEDDDDIAIHYSL